MTTFKCEECGKMFRSKWTNAEAEAELAQNFPDVPVEECVRVCEPCYHEIMLRLSLEANQ